ncbi:MAG: nitroreductase family protein [Methanomicrobiaceae archaeon]|nr:nitroreductase family protein [Methanomicrobiaceae archaeon]MDD5418748.1 nitroreductase family protein [Methanomicrobiaceae archaeon]
MEYRDLIRQRCSVRRFRPDPVPEALQNEVLEAARAAPSAANRQPFRLIVIRTEGRKAELERIYGRPWFAEAPLIVCAAAVPSEAWTHTDGTNYAWVDTAIAMDHLILAAANEGLGTCWVAAFDRAAAREVLGLPDGVEPVAFTPLGYPDEPPGKKVRKPVNELVKFDRW